MKVLSVDGRPASKARHFMAVRLGIAQCAAFGVLVLFDIAVSAQARTHLAVTLSTAGLALAYAVVQLFLPARRSLLPLFGIASGVYIVNASVAIAATGGAESPLRVLLIFSVVYAAWFYETRAAMAILAGVMVAVALPLAYDGHTGGAQVAATVALGSVLVLAGWLMLAGRRELVRLRERARLEARRDPVTDLANRRALIRHLDRLVTGRRDADRFGIVFLDLDGFKQVNTAHGHAGGDAALKAVAAALRDIAREDDLVARVAGDEFAIVAHRTTAEGLRMLAQRAVDAIAAASVEEHPATLGASAGVALWPDDAGDADGVLRAADLAMLAAKRAGKGRVVAACEDRAAIS